MKCQHEWEYFDEHDFPNGYEYDQWNIPHKRCKKCGREYELFDGYGEYANRWRKVEPWSPELHKLEQELILTRKALDKGMEHITGLNNMIESWLKLIDSDFDQETKLRILKSAISAYVENKGGDNEK
jgi:hypothetical protein